MRLVFSALAILAISLIAFSFPETQQTAAKPIAPPDDPPTVNFCELAERPNDYNNKIVRVEANYFVRPLASYLYADNCNTNRYKIRVLDCPDDSGEYGMCIDCTRDELNECGKLHGEFRKVLGPYLRPNKNHSASRVRGVLVGHLIGPDQGRLSLSDYVFDIQKFEKGMVIPDNVRW